MASRASSTDPRAERVRAQMKQAALALIHERRVEDISVATIVGRARVSRQVFYQHFTDRDDAIASALNEDFDTTVSATGRTPDEVIAALLRYAADNAELYFNLYPSIASQRSTQAFRAHLRPACQQIVDELWGTIDGGAPKSVLTTFLLGGLMEILTDWAARRGTEDLSAQVDNLLRTFRSVMAG